MKEIEGLGTHAPQGSLFFLEGMQKNGGGGIGKQKRRTEIGLGTANILRTQSTQKETVRRKKIRGVGEKLIAVALPKNSEEKWWGVNFTLYKTIEQQNSLLSSTETVPCCHYTLFVALVFPS